MNAAVIRNLSPDQYALLYNTLEEAYDAESSGRIGTHFQLVFVLGQLGYRLNGTSAATQVAQEILDGQPVYSHEKRGG